MWLIARWVACLASGRGLIPVNFSLSSRANRGRKIGGIHIFLNKQFASSGIAKHPCCTSKRDVLMTHYCLERKKERKEVKFQHTEEFESTTSWLRGMCSTAVLPTLPGNRRESSVFLMDTYHWKYRTSNLNSMYLLQNSGTKRQMCLWHVSFAHYNKASSFQFWCLVLVYQCILIKNLTCVY